MGSQKLHLIQVSYKYIAALLLSLEYDLWVLEIGYYSIESAIQIGYPYIFLSIKATKKEENVNKHYFSIVLN